MLFIPIHLAAFHCLYLSTPYLVAYTEAVIFCSRHKKVVEFVKAQYSEWYILVATLSQKYL